MNAEREALERAWREGFQSARECLTEDDAFTLTEDVEEDCWCDSATRQALANPAIAAMHRPLEREWQAIDDDCPRGCHVLAARFDNSFGEWIYGVVMAPPSKPFTHWMPLPAPPTAQSEKA